MAQTTLAGALAVLAVTTLAQAGLSNLFSIPEVYADIKSCLSQPSFYSCENTTAIHNTCCSPTPGGLGMSPYFPPRPSFR